MSTRHQIRELALQALYQYDLRGVSDAAAIEQTVLDAPQPESLKQQAIEIAKLAWAERAKCDSLATELAPTWPTNRQPTVDRCILRLAYYEIASGMTPVPVAIDEAVELAKTFGGQRSPSFINGVLDQIAKRLQNIAPQAKPPLPASQAQDVWLDDAVKNSSISPDS